MQAAAAALTLALAGATPAMAAAPVTPRIVLQSDIKGGIEVAAWTPDGRYLVTGSGLSRSVIIWELATGILIDRAVLTSPDPAARNDQLRLTGIDISPDGRTAIVHGIGSVIENQGKPVSREFAVDLATRQVRPLPPKPLPPGTKGLDGVQDYVTALTAIYEGDPAMTPAQAATMLPRLPRGPDGTTLTRTAKGLVLRAPDGSVHVLGGQQRTPYLDAALAPDGHQLVLTVDSEGDPSAAGTTRYIRFDLANATYAPPLTLRGTFGRVTWLDNSRLLVSSDSDDGNRDSDDPDDAGPPAPALVVEAASGRTQLAMPPMCYVQPLGDGRFIGAYPANCRTKAGNVYGVAVFDGTAWRRLNVPQMADVYVNGMAVAPVGNAVAAIIADAKDVQQVWVFDRNTGKVLAGLSHPEGAPEITGIAFTPDGQQLIVAQNGGMAAWRYGTGDPRVLNGATLVPQFILSDGQQVLSSGISDTSVSRTDLATGKALPPLPHERVVAAGLIPGKPLFWTVSAFDGLRIWDARTLQPVMSTWHLANDRFVTVAADGRYDTNLGPDARDFRWIMPDAPFQSLAPQTFMRDYYEPRLAQKLMDCTPANSCDSVLPPLPPLAGLNRVLPELRIAGIQPDPARPQVAVTVEAREGTNPQAANGKTRSGLYDIRLFRDGKLVAQQPVPPAVQTSDTISQWRQDNRLATGPDGTYRTAATIAVPLSGLSAQTFSAYAFNEDRVKGDTALATWQRPPVNGTVVRRAFVLTIGVDDYNESRLRLRFAGRDANILGDRLATIPGYQVHRLTMTTAPGPDGKPRQVTKRAIATALAILGGAGPDAAKALAAMGFDASALDGVTPDDIVILSFSGHGWADTGGAFYLVPVEGSWPSGAARPDIASLISSAELTQWLSPIIAADMAVIIDACHSAASVDVPGFKPGPMGDRGLGQLAYDKGIRILAATQAADSALENDRLGQGLLSFALAGEGIDASGFGRADLNGDGRITLDEWLLYATKRLPGLSADVAAGTVGAPGTGSRDFDLGNTGSPPPPAKPQEPSLFDFTGAPSLVVLRSR
jgi:WD40 repeat protein